MRLGIHMTKVSLVGIRMAMTAVDVHVTVRRRYLAAASCRTVYCIISGIYPCQQYNQNYNRQQTT